MTKLAEFKQVRTAKGDAAANRRLLEWLSNDGERADLYRCMELLPGPLQFVSPANTQTWAYDPAAPVYSQGVYLLGNKDHIERAFKPNAGFSNAPFQALGGGNFMLGLDPGAAHDAQRLFALGQLAIGPTQLLALVTVAFQAGAVLGLKQRKFDVAELASMVAVRYMGLMFGFAQSDHALIDITMQKAHKGLCYQAMGRHFVSEPGIVPEANAAMGMMLRRTAELIGLYQGANANTGSPQTACTRCGRLGHADGIGCAQADETNLLARELKELQEFAAPDRPNVRDLAGFQPILRKIAASNHGLTSTEAAVVVVGLIAGAIGNIQASVCIAIHHFFQLKSGVDLERVVKLAVDARQLSRGAAADPELTTCVQEALRRNPPVAFLPRLTLEDIRFNSPTGPIDIPAGHVVLLGMGGATRCRRDDGVDTTGAPDGTPGAYVLPPAPSSAAAGPAAGCPYHSPLVFGGDKADKARPHSCVGQDLALPMVVHTVRQLMALQGLAEACDPRTGRPAGLRKLWGYGCESYPMEFRRETILVQSPLTVIMKIKSPTAEHAEKLKAVIKYGAPSIEKKLKDARHVHFASFQFLENDTKLALFTVFDRDFDSYIAHFALEIGPLFDKIFAHIVDAPPLPVDEFPREFVETIRRYNLPPAAGYFFSAYPNANAADLIAEHEREYP